MPIKDKKLPQKKANWAFLILSAVLLISTFLPQSLGQADNKVPYSTFISQVEAHQVSSASVGEKAIRYQLEGDGAMYSTNPVFDLNLPTMLQENGVEFSAQPQGNQWFSNLLSWVIPPLIFVGIWRIFLMRGQGGSGSGLFSIGKSKAKVYVENEDTKTTFEDVAGVDEA